MNKKFTYWLLITLPLILCTSCEYDLEKINYVEIEKPLEPNYNMEIKAPVNEKGEYIIKYSRVNFDFELPENIEEIRLHLYRENIDYSYTTYYIDRNTHFILLEGRNPGVYKITCEIPYQRTNTGSIAAVSGYEYYGKTFEWKIVLEKNSIPSLNLRYDRLDDTTFKLSWDKPDPDYGEIDYYEISYWYDNYSLDTTTDTSHIVTLPQWDSREYYVRAYFKESYISPLESYVYINNY